MAVQKMKKICLCAGKQDRKAVLEMLQRMGTVEIRREDPAGDGLNQMDMSEALAGLEEKIGMIGRALQILFRLEPEKRSLFAALEGKRLPAGDLYKKGEACRERICGCAERILELAGEMEALEAENGRIGERIRELEPWKTLEFPLDDPGTKNFVVILGSLAQMPQEQQIRQLLEEGFEENGEDVCRHEGEPEISGREQGRAYLEIFGQKRGGAPLEVFGREQGRAYLEISDREQGNVYLEILGRERGRTYLGILCGRDDESRVRELLGSRGFVPAPGGGQGETPAGEIQRLKAASRRNRDRILGCRQEIGKMQGRREELERTEDYFRVRAQKYRVLGELWQSRTVFFLEGYVPEAAAEKVKARILEHFAAQVEIRDPEAGEQAPVLLKNGRIAESVQGVLESFGLPRRGETDPTAVMWVFYVFFFGMMLADAAYGFLVAASCGILLLRFRGMPEAWRRSVKLFFWCGISTLIWGVLFGSYFGDALDVAAEAFWGVRLPEGESLLPAVWFAPIQDPMKMLLYAMLFGLIHLLTGLAIRGLRYLREKRYGDFFCQVVLWYVLLAGLLLLLLPGEIFRSVTGIRLDFPLALTAAGKILAAAGALGILLFAGRRAQNPAVRLALGAYELYGVTGWLGDVLSYSRLLALGLATGVIASVINQMGVMLGPVGFFVVFLAGHLLNLAINLLGAYVHTCRLQYVEFFGKFYEGGGRPFAPFAQETKYVEIKEEMGL